jgi:hypothetical protein
LVAADVVVRQEPADKEDEGEAKKDDDEDDDGYSE